MGERFGLLLLLSFLSAFVAPAQTVKLSAKSKLRPIQLDVVVTDESGLSVSGLTQKDFTIFDGHTSQTIASFEAVDGRQAPTELLIVLDGVNTDPRNVDIAREGITRFLKADEGRLAYPTMVVILAGTTIQLTEDFSQDGNAISATLDERTVALRDISRSANLYGAAARFQFSLQGLRVILARETGRPKRKIILWVSPGWPVFSGSQHMLDSEQEKRMLGEIVDISTQLRESQIMLYTIDFVGAKDTDAPLPDWEGYFKGIDKPSEVRRGHLALEVIANQSGGLALSTSVDLAAQLQKCVADTQVYYQISFDAATTERPNEYHLLEIQVAKPGVTARTRLGYYAQPWRAGNSDFDSGETGTVASDTLRYKKPRGDLANPHPYADEPLTQLAERIPELKTLESASDQQKLAMILQSMGQKVDQFVQDVGDLIARETVTQEKLNANGDVKAKKRFEDDYLILHHGDEWGASAEYRMNEKGKRLGPIGLEEGFLATSGYALSAIGFATKVQAQSRFRYLGQQMINAKKTYVLIFTQQPAEARFTTAMILNEGIPADMLMQGILWVDEDSFQIIRMRTDLLAQRNDIRLDQLTSYVTFGEVRLQDELSPLRLPSDVHVDVEIHGHKFRNLHHYTNYRRYRVSVKIGTS